MALVVLFMGAVFILTNIVGVLSYPFASFPGISLILGALFLLSYGVFATDWYITSEEKNRRHYYIWGTMSFLHLMLFVVSWGTVFVTPDQAVVVVSPRYPEGIRPEPLAPGLHILIPVIDKTHKYPLTHQTLSMSGDNAIEARTLDGRRVLVEASVIYALDFGQVVNVHKQWKTRYTTDLIAPVTRGIVQDVVATYRSNEMIGAREEIAQEIKKRLSSQLQEQGITVMELVLQDFVLICDISRQ